MNIKNKKFRAAFSLMEVLMAVGVLSIGLLLVAGTFPAGIFLTAASTEQSVAPIIAGEAFAKLQLANNDVNNFQIFDIKKLSYNAQEDILNARSTFMNRTRCRLNEVDRTWPSVGATKDKVYYWSALARRMGSEEMGIFRNNNGDPSRFVQVTVFVTRKPNLSEIKYVDPNNKDSLVDFAVWPLPVCVDVASASANSRRIELGFNDMGLVNDGDIIVGDKTGTIYRVLGRQTPLTGTAQTELLLDTEWKEESVTGARRIWVVPPAKTGGKSACIGVFQRILEF